MEEIKSLIPQDIVEEIREGTISFLEQNKNHLPMYYIPKQVVWFPKQSYISLQFFQIYFFKFSLIKLIWWSPKSLNSLNLSTYLFSALLKIEEYFLLELNLMQ